MKSRLIFLCVFVLLIVLGACCGPRILDWIRQPRIKSPEELLEPLTEAQVRCIEQVTSREKLIYVERQEVDGFLGIGYVVSDGFYAAMLKVDQNSNCSIEFQRSVFDLQDYYGNIKKIVFLGVQRVELTGDMTPEIYVQLNQYQTGRRDSAVHGVYAKQIDGSYETILFLGLCRDWSSLEITQLAGEDKPRIIIMEDIGCDWSPGKKEYTELILTNQGREILRVWQNE